MQYRQFGRTELSVSDIGFGCWQLGGGWGRQDDREGIRALQVAFDKGVTFYDTAMAYGNGHSEQILGKVFKKGRDKIKIASKISPEINIWPALDTDPVEKSFAAEWIVECTEKSLKRLNTDYIDIQQFHCWADPWLESGDWLQAVEKLKKEGKIRYFGVSTNDWDPYNTVSLIESDLIDSVQVIYNLFDQRAAEKLLPAALKHQVGIIVRVPFEEGLLTGKFKPGVQWEKGDWRANWMTDERLKTATPRIEALQQESKEFGLDLPSLSLQFILAHPAVSVVIPGMRKVEHVKANTAVSDLAPLSQDVLDRLYEHKWYHGWLYPWDRRLG